MSSGFGAGLIVVMFIGAARADATPEQVQRLRDEALPLLKAATPARQAMINAVEKTAEIMGPGWEPREEYSVWIESLLHS